MILTKLKDFVGITEHEDYDEDYEEMEWEKTPTMGEKPTANLRAIVPQTYTASKTR